MLGSDQPAARSGHPELDSIDRKEGADDALRVADHGLFLSPASKDACPLARIILECID